jgi:hypothetical protein
LGPETADPNVCFQNQNSFENLVNMVVINNNSCCNYRSNHFYLLIPVLMCSLKSYKFQTKSKQCH